LELNQHRAGHRAVKMMALIVEPFLVSLFRYFSSVPAIGVVPVAVAVAYVAAVVVELSLGSSYFSQNKIFFDFLD
jgi:hypothetical protein